MKIFVADRISPLGVEYLKKQDGFEVVEAYGSSPEEVIEIAKDSTEKAVVDKALSFENVEKFTSNGSIVKTIYVPNRLLNFVVK